LAVERGFCGGGVSDDQATVRVAWVSCDPRMGYIKSMDNKWRTHELVVSGEGSGVDLVDHEWLLTNGTGAYAMGTSAGINTRRYHGLFVAATKPPVGRVMAVNQFHEQLLLEGCDSSQGLAFTSCSFVDPNGGGVISPRGHTMLRRFEKGLSVRWVYRCGGAGLGLGGLEVEFVRELWLGWEQQAAVLRYEVRGFEGGQPAALPGGVLRLSPMLTLRDFHSLTRMETAGAVSIEIKEKGVVSICRGDLAVTLQCEGAEFVGVAPPSDPWWYGIDYPLERERGQEDLEDYFVPGRFEVELGVEHEAVASVTLAFGDQPVEGGVWLGTDREGHLEGILKALHAGVDGDDSTKRVMAIASDDFVVSRRFRGRSLKTVMAGYPWFSDWGRDTFISLPGLLLTTGRFEEARLILSVFSEAIQDGLIPNRFDDYDESVAHYNSVDASLWFVNAAMAYVKASGDEAAWGGWLADAAIKVVDSFLRGTVYDIRMAGDGLVTAGSPSTQLTWMDAACDGVVFTPRHGKAVEINALWHHGLCCLTEMVDGKQEAAEYREQAEQCAASFREQFWWDEKGCCHDVLVPISGNHADGGFAPDGGQKSSICFCRIFSVNRSLRGHSFNSFGRQFPIGGGIRLSLCRVCC